LEGLPKLTNLATDLRRTQLISTEGRQIRLTDGAVALGP
jgi:hypothetical protein